MVKFKNPFKKDQEIAIVSNDKIKDELRLAQAKALIDKNEHTKQDRNSSSDQDFDDEDFERDEDLSRTETIDPIKLNKRRLDSLQQIYAELDKQDKEQSLKLKILKKKETINKKKEQYQELMDIQAEQDKFYEKPRNSEGYFELKEEKWNEEYDEWLEKLGHAKDDKERKAYNKQLKRLEGIRSKNKQKNRMNRIVRGINKTTQKIGGGSRAVGKFMNELSNELGTLGNMGGKPQSSGKKQPDFSTFFNDKPSQNGKGTDWENFFRDKPKANRKSTKTKTTKTKKKKSKKKKSKKKTAKPVEQQKPKPKGIFDGF